MSQLTHPPVDYPQSGTAPEDVAAEPDRAASPSRAAVVTNHG
ncbi:hypothetical protein AB0883_03780 [Micromonospora sp. NPDC047812]